MRSISYLDNQAVFRVENAAISHRFRCRAARQPPRAHSSRRENPDWELERRPLALRWYSG